MSWIRNGFAIGMVFLTSCGLVKLERPPKPGEGSKAGEGSTPGEGSSGAGKSSESRVAQDCSNVGCTITALGAEELKDKVAELDKFMRAACEKIHEYALPGDVASLTENRRVIGRMSTKV
jgi:hypothetical protein